MDDKAPATVGAVVSNNAAGGVTAGFVANLQQTNILPSVVRGPLLASFKQRFTIGAQLYRFVQDANHSDDEFKTAFADIDLWYASTFHWLQTSVSDWAAERFAFRTGTAMTWGLSGTHAPEVVTMRSNYLNNLYPMLQNLDQLMREPSVYPDEKVANH